MASLQERVNAWQNRLEALANELVCLQVGRLHVRQARRLSHARCAVYAVLAPNPENGQLVPVLFVPAQDVLDQDWTEVDARDALQADLRCACGQAGVRLAC